MEETNVKCGHIEFVEFYSDTIKLKRKALGTGHIFVCALDSYVIDSCN